MKQELFNFFKKIYSRQGLFMRMVDRVRRWAEYSRFNKRRVFPRWAVADEESFNSPVKRNIEDGALVWRIKSGELPHADHVEMAGFYSAHIINYGADNSGRLRLFRHCVFPMLRTLPDDTHASFAYNFDINDAYTLGNGREKLVTVTFNGDLIIESKCGSAKIKRELITAVNSPALIERVTVINNGNKDFPILRWDYKHKTKAKKGLYGSYEVAAIAAPGAAVVAEGESFTFCTIYTAHILGQEKTIDAEAEISARHRFIKGVFGGLSIESPDPLLNTAFSYTSLRGTESIYKTKGGLMHGPGGGSYYAAMWTNDQCEYANPVFPLFGYGIALEEAINSYRMFGQSLDGSNKKAMRTSIIAEGRGFWHGAKDRGDSAMYAGGCSRFLLAYGDEEQAREFFPYIKLCNEYTISKINSENVVESDSDELEGRFPSGKANLATNCIAIDGFTHGAYLADALGEKELAEKYRGYAALLTQSVEDYFGMDMKGFHTYKYYKECEKLRAWICLPLVFGIKARARGTLDALFSPVLWKNNAMLTEEGSTTLWDRAALFALRGAFIAGESAEATKRLTDYTASRLTGSHIPYPYEAFPEGNRKHLSGESVLYTRIYLEGVMGMRFTAFDAVEFTPSLSPDWEFFKVKNITLRGARYDVEVLREKDRLAVTLLNKNGSAKREYIAESETARFKI